MGLAWQFGNLHLFGYDLIIAAPPWDFENYSEAGTNKGADPHHSVMPLTDIAALPVGQPVAIVCSCFGHAGGQWQRGMRRPWRALGASRLNRRSSGAS
jgi:hypothetical protein